MSLSRPNEYTRWNFVVISLDAICFMGTMACIDPTTVMPVLLTNLTDSKFIIGLFGTIQRAGWLLPQLLGTCFILHRAHRKPFVLYPAIFSRLPIYLLAALLLHPWSRTHPTALLIILAVGYACFCFGDGLGGVPWHDIIARTIPATWRGRFFGTINAGTGLLGLGSAVIVRYALAPGGPTFPYNFGLLFGVFCIGLTLSTIFLCFMREPKSEAVTEAQSLPTLIRSIPRTLREYPRLRRLIFGQIICGLSGLASQFYVVYAVKQLGILPEVTGLFITAGLVGNIGSSFLWAYLSDRVGSTKVIRGVTIILFFVPIAALAIPVFVHTVSLLSYCYALVFLLSGMTGGGMWMGPVAYVMEIAPDHHRPIFLGLQSTLSFPTVFMPTIGGLLIDHRVVSYQMLFALVAVTSLLGALYMRRLPEPRHAPETIATTV